MNLYEYELRGEIERAKLMHESRPGFVGTGITIGTALIGRLAENLPELQAIAFTLSILVGALSLCWWIRKWYRVIKDRRENE